jgi:hypothetical protein
VSSLLAFTACATTIEPQLERELYVRAGKSARFDATQTQAPESKFLWEFGDGKKDQGASVLHAYAKPGTYEATLKIKGGGKKGRAVVRVVVAPPSALDVCPKDTAAAFVSDSAQEARAAWDLLAALPLMKDELAEARKELEKELEFFPLDAEALSARGLDPSRGVGACLVSAGGDDVFVLAVGMQPGDAAISWLQGVASREGFSLEESGKDRWRAKFGASEFLLGRANGFLLVVPAVSQNAEQVFSAALAASNGEALGDQEWVERVQVRGALGVYLRGGEVPRTLSGLVRGGGFGLPSLPGIWSSVRGVGLGLQAKKNQLLLSSLVWMTEEGAARSKILSPEGAAFALSPDLTRGAVLYAAGRLDLVALGQGLFAQLPKSTQRDLSDGLTMARSLIGIDLVRDLGEPLGDAALLVVRPDADGLAALANGGQATPGEVILAYQVEDMPRFSSSVEKLVSAIQPLGAGFGLSISKKESGGATLHNFNAGFLDVSLALKGDMLLLTGGPSALVMEKALELVSPASSAVKAGKPASPAPAQQIFVSLSALRSVLSEASQQMRDAEDANEIINYLSGMELLDMSASLVQETARIKVSLTLSPR